MPDILTKLNDKLKELTANMEREKKTRLFLLGALIIIILVVAFLLLNQKSYSVLYSGMKSEDAGQVLSMLQDMGVDAKTQGSDTILVESGKADKIRMELAAEGYPTSGFNYDIFAKASGLGTTDMEKKVYLQFQTQEHIRQTLIKMDKVEDAVVNISLPDDSLFVIKDNQKDASAAIMLMVKAGETLTNLEVKAIGELVSTSVSGLSIEDVRIVDSKMNLYEIAKEGEIGNMSSHMELTQTIKNSIQEQITNLLIPVFGKDNVLAEVNVKLNFDRETTESIIFSPPLDGEEEGLVAGLSELNEYIRNYGTSGVPGLDTNSVAPEYPAGSLEDGLYEKVSRDVTLRLNETKTLVERGSGDIEELSVALIINSESGVSDYTDNVRELVAGAVGVSEDMVTVEMLPFMAIEGEGGDDVFAQQQEIIDALKGGKLKRILIIAGTAIILMLLIMFTVRSLRPQPEPIYYEEEGVYPEDGQYAYAEDGSYEPGEEPFEPIDFESKNTDLAQLEDYIDKSPEAVAQLLKGWLADD